MLTNTKKLILCANNNRLTAGVWRGNKLISFRAFSNAEQDDENFSEYLAQNFSTPVYLIVDAVEEEYKLESLPHTTGRAREEIIARKLNQFNRNSVFRAAHFIKRSQDKRRDDNFLFVALSNPDWLQAWINIIQANQFPLVGIYLLPMISQGIVRQMKLMAPHILLCEQLSSGLRQTYLHNGRLRMSRLAPMHDIKPNQLAYFYLVEIEKTRLYLTSQRLITSDTALQMVLPSQENSHHLIATSISQDQGLECKTVDILAFAKNCNLAPDLILAHPELLHMQLLANGSLPDNLAPALYSKIHQLNNTRNALHIATAAVSITGVVLASFYALQVYKLEQSIKLAATQIQEQTRLYNEVAKNFPATPIASAELKVAAELAQIIQNNQHSPLQLMQALSNASEFAADINFTKIRWVLSPTIDSDDDNTNGTPSSNQSNQLLAMTNITKLYQIGFVSAEIKNFKGDYRAAINTVSQLVANLNKNEGVQQVLILQEPVNVSSLANLQGSTTDEASAAPPPASFKLKVVLKQSSVAPAISNVASKAEL